MASHLITATDQLTRFGVGFPGWRAKWLAMATLFFYGCLSQQSALAQSSTENHHSNSGRKQIVVPECRISIVQEVRLSCERSGMLEYVTPVGSIVRQGEVVVRLRDSVAKAAFEIAARESANDIEIRFAKKAGELAQLKYERAQQADRNIAGTVTEFELRELRLAAEKSLLQLQQAEHQFAIANLKKAEQQQVLNSHQVIAPFDAYVRVSDKKPGEYVQEGETVVEIINDQLIRVNGLIDIGDLSSLGIGNEVAIYYYETEEKRHTFRGQISFIDQKIDPISMKARVTAEVMNSNSILKDGLLVTMAIAPYRAAARSASNTLE